MIFQRSGSHSRRAFLPEVLILLGGVFSTLLILFSLHPAKGEAAGPALPESVTLRAGDYEETVPREKIASWYHLTTKLVPTLDRRSEAENIFYCPTVAAESHYCVFSLSRESRTRLTINLTSELDEETVKGYVSELALKVNQDPVNATFAMNEENQVIVAAQEEMGRALKEEESKALLVRALHSGKAEQMNISLPTAVTEPKVVASDRERLNLKDLVGEGKTNFAGSPKNRVYNIKRSLEQFQGIIISPGEEFSFVDYLGEVDGEHGYLPELVIKNNKTEPEFGGGICQVSSTVFRAAIYSGMEITERRNHAYPVQYYKPYGMDATIYIPKPDLRFKNNTPGHILMQSEVVGNNLIFRFYGTKDGRTTTVDGPHILESNADGSMKTVFSQTVNDKDGKELIKDTFWSNYKSPSLFPHPGEEILSEKPKNWSDKQWRDYKRIHP